MTKTKIKEIVAKCLKDRKLCRIYFKYDKNYFYFFPLIFNDRLFLNAEEDDFILNGYSIRRFKDVTKAELKNDLCEEILKLEGIVDSIVVPNIDITNWKTIFKSLQEKGNNIIVEKESLDEDDTEFAIGRIEKVYKNFVYFRHFDADGIWQDEPYKIPYTEITSVTFSSRYVDIFSKYLAPLPDNFGK